jgi:hypothetical protein
MIPSEIRVAFDSFFDAHAHEHNFSTAEGCGLYMEAAIPYVRSLGYTKVGYLLYNGSGTKYNGHRIDSFLYNEVTENGKLQSCDVIANAETTYAGKGWSPDEPRYSASDWSATVLSSPAPKTVPYKAYEGDEYWHEQVGKILYADYIRAGRTGLDSMSSVWTARTIHDIKMEGLSPSNSVAKHRIEWCAGLGIPVQ